MATPVARTLVRVDIDTQHGFCDPTGALYVRNAETALPNVRRLNEDAARRGIWLIGSVDAHDYATPEFKENGGIWPVHCVKGTWDQLKVEETLPPRYRFVPPVPCDVARLFDGGKAALYFEKDAYSVAANPNFAPFLDYLCGRVGGAERLAFQVYGVATDYCVRMGALELRRRLPLADVAVVIDATAGVAPDTTEDALRAFREGGVRIIASTPEALG